MTGHGHATLERDQIRIAVEIKSVNSRFLKISTHSELSAAALTQVESLIKASAARGSVNVRVNVNYLDGAQRYQLNESAIRQYWLQLSEIAGSSQSVNLEAILSLPGVVNECVAGEEDESFLQLLQETVRAAIEPFQAMRRTEGEAMKSDMLTNIEKITIELDSIKTLAPEVVSHYSERLTERINRMLEGFEVTVSETDVIKEVGVFADRCDISEETMRLGSHLQQFAQVVQQDSPGKKLDFLVQEMLRETNTIGSKANDASIARHVVEIKSSIERIREMVQNIE